MLLADWKLKFSFSLSENMCCSVFFARNIIIICHESSQIAPQNSSSHQHQWDTLHVLSVKAHLSPRQLWLLQGVCVQQVDVADHASHHQMSVATIHVWTSWCIHDSALHQWYDRHSRLCFKLHSHHWCKHHDLSLSQSCHEFQYLISISEFNLSLSSLWI